MCSLALPPALGADIGKAAVPQLLKRRLPVTIRVWSLRLFAPALDSGYTGSNYSQDSALLLVSGVNRELKVSAYRWGDWSKTDPGVHQASLTYVHSSQLDCAVHHLRWLAPPDTIEGLVQAFNQIPGSPLIFSWRSNGHQSRN